MTVPQLVTELSNLLTSIVPANTFSTIVLVGVIVAGAAALASRLRRLGK